MFNISDVVKVKKSIILEYQQQFVNNNGVIVKIKERKDMPTFYCLQFYDTKLNKVNNLYNGIGWLEEELELV